MNGPAPAWLSQSTARTAIAAGQHGVLLRLARVAAGLTLAEAGRLAGYSGATLSRLERGIQPLTDVRTLRHLATVFDIPLSAFGLAESPTTFTTSGPVVDRLPERSTEGGDTMRRRDFLGGMTGMAMGSLLPGSDPDPIRRLAVAIERGLSAPASASGLLDPASLRVGMIAAKRDFQASRYRALADRLPGLLAAADSDRSADPATVAELYNTATHVLIKLEIAGPDWVTANRAMVAAKASGDPLVIANVTRNMVSIYRRAYRYADAEELALGTAEQLDISGPNAGAAHLSLYGMLLCNAGYAAAQRGDRSRSAELLDHADEIAARTGRDDNQHWTAFGPTNVISHRISAAYALGDAGTAIHHAATVAPGTIVMPERQSRFWVDVARAYHQWGRPAKAYQALLTAERAAPEEVRSRPTVRNLTTDLLHVPTQTGLTGLRDLADRVGSQG